MIPAWPCPTGWCLPPRGPRPLGPLALPQGPRASRSPRPPAPSSAVGPSEVPAAPGAPGPAPHPAGGTLKRPRGSPVDGPGRGKLSPGPTDPSPTRSYPRSPNSPHPGWRPIHPSPWSHPQASRSLSCSLRKGGHCKPQSCTHPQMCQFSQAPARCQGSGVGCPKEMLVAAPEDRQTDRAR